MLIGRGFARTLLLVLAGCGGGASPVGNGIGPSSIAIAAATGTTATTEGVVRVFQCLTGGLTAALRFTDGSSGDFTSRVTWTSANPSVVRVSNGDIPVPGSSAVYAQGTLVPVSPGTAIVTATYATLTAQVTVSVGTPSAFSMAEIGQGAVMTPITTATLGAGTSAQFGVTAVIDGVSRDASSYATWTVGGSGIASVSAAGLVSALGAGGPATLTASFPNCAQSVASTISVANILGIELVPEFGTAPLLLENRERFDVLANLGNGIKQDVSLLATLAVTDSTVAAFMTGSGLSNILQPSAAGVETVTAQLNNAYTAPEQTINITSSPLTVISVAPATAVVRAGSNETARFTATGTFGNGQVQDVTRAVTWAVADTALATISDTASTAGVAVAAGNTTGQTTVTASSTLETAVSPSMATLTIDSAENPVDR
jgi:hypothetical protein